MLEYGRQFIEEDDIEAVVRVLRGDLLTTGPSVAAFESELAQLVGAEHAIVCNSGTAALYLAMRASLQPGDCVVVPAVTFAATASAAILSGLDVMFADVDADTGLMSATHLEEALDRAGMRRVRAVLPVHLGGRVDRPEKLAAVAKSHGLIVIEDACHALGTAYGDARIGACRDSLAACFSFHPIKTIAMGEGGAITTNLADFADKVRHLRNHGMVRQPNEYRNQDLAFDADGSPNLWYYEIQEPSHNFRASDINCALGLSQLRKINWFLKVRHGLMERYRERLVGFDPLIKLAPVNDDVDPGWHLCTVLIDFRELGLDRNALMMRLREKGIGTQVHYIPVNLHPFYRTAKQELECSGAREYYERTLSLPIHVGMTLDDVDFVVDALLKATKTKS